MLRNNLIRQHSKVWYILNEVLSLNAQESGQELNLLLQLEVSSMKS